MEESRPLHTPDRGLPPGLHSPASPDSSPAFDLEGVSLPPRTGPHTGAPGIEISLSAEQIRHYENLLKLPATTGRLLSAGDVTFTRISGAAAADCGTVASHLAALDVHSYPDEQMKLAYHAALSYVVSPERLAGDGVLVRLHGQVVGYCLLYRVANELMADGTQRTDLPSTMKEVRDRVKWDEIADYLTSLGGGASPVTQSGIWHLYDVAVPGAALRSYGLGRLALFLSRDVAVPPGEACVGFIVENNYSSLLSMTKAGRLLGKVIETDPYDGGPRRAFISLNVVGRHPIYTGKAIAFDPKVDPVSRLPAAIAAVVSGEGALVGFNPASGRLEEVRFA